MGSTQTGAGSFSRRCAIANPVWVLSVDLQTKTATFQSGMAEAARSARGAFGEIKSGAADMGEGVARSSTNVRAAIGLLDNTIRGDHMRALADLVREYSQTSFVMAAIPFAATAGAIALAATAVFAAVEHFRALREEQEKLRDEQTTFGTSIQNVFNGLDDKLLTAEARADELRNDHLGALQKELELINHQSMGELVKSLETVAKAADVVFGDLKSHWYTFGIGSAGAQHALSQFQTQYDSLLAQGKSSEASDLLKGTRDSAQHILDAQKFMQAGMSGGGSSLLGASGDYFQILATRNELQKAGVGYTDKEVQAQEALVSALNAQMGVEQRVSELKKLDSGNATGQLHNTMSAQKSAAERESAQSQLRMGQSAIAADKATADARLTIQRASIEQRLQSDLDFADREYQTQLAGNQAQIAALDKSGKDYENQLKSLQDKALELQAQHETQVAQLKVKASVEEYQRDLQNLEQSERQKIAATSKGSEERLAAIDAAIKEEQSRNLQDTNFYRELLTQRVEVTRQMLEEENKLKAEAAKEAADNDLKMGELALAAERERDALLDSSRRMTAQKRMQDDIKYANEEFQLKQAALEREIAGLDKSGNDYANKLKALQDKEKQLVQQHENEVTAIKEKAETDRNNSILDAERRFEDDITRGLAQVIMGHETFGKMMTQIGDQVASGMIQTAIKSMMAEDMTKEKDAAAAARKMFIAGTHFPFPANIVMAPALGAMAFASVMAYQEGGIVPGVGRGDIVPAMLEPGEGVVPKGVMEGLSSVARNGSFNAPSQQIHVHVRPTYHVQTIDGDGMRAALDKHTDVLQQHFENTLRRMNR